MFQRKQISFSVKEAMFGVSHCADFSCFCIFHFIGQFQPNAIVFFHPCLDGYGFPKTGHGLILAVYFQYRAYDSFCLHPVISHPKLFHQIGSCFFKPPNIIGMMHDSHLIGLIILCFVLIDMKNINYFLLLLFINCEI